jgi:hypothetical protein
MGDELVIVPSDGDGYVSLARRRNGTPLPQAPAQQRAAAAPQDRADHRRRRRLHLPAEKNFDDGVCDIVQVPLANANNAHSEDPERNIGEVVDIESTPATRSTPSSTSATRRTHPKLGKTYLGASAMLSLDYTNTKTGEKVGPTLLHSCVTNRPYVTGLDEYEEIVAATTDRSDEATVLLSDNTVVIEKPSKETEMPEQETETVAEPSWRICSPPSRTSTTSTSPPSRRSRPRAPKQTELSQTIVDALKAAGVVKLSNTDDDKVGTETVITAVQELATNNVTLTNRLTTLEKRDAEHAVDALITEGRILPAQREVMVDMKLSHPDMFDKVVPASRW